MESSARSGTPARSRKRGLGPFFFGLLLGVLGTIFLPPLVRPYLPASLRGEKVEVGGVVAAKAREPERLLLTIESAQGAVLATWKKRIPEIDLLVSEGDSIVIGVDSYAPFVSDPTIRRVLKRDERERRASEPAARPVSPPADDTSGEAGGAAPGAQGEGEAGSDTAGGDEVGTRPAREAGTPGADTSGGTGG